MMRFFSLHPNLHWWIDTESNILCLNCETQYAWGLYAIVNVCECLLSFANATAVYGNEFYLSLYCTLFVAVFKKNSRIESIQNHFFEQVFWASIMIREMGIILKDKIPTIVVNIASFKHFQTCADFRECKYQTHSPRHKNP